MRKEVWIILGAGIVSGYCFGMAGPMSIVIVCFGFMVFGKD
jgi:hypothetical protein